MWQGVTAIAAKTYLRRRLSICLGRMVAISIHKRMPDRSFRTIVSLGSCESYKYPHILVLDLVDGYRVKSQLRPLCVNSLSAILWQWVHRTRYRQNEKSERASFCTKNCIVLSRAKVLHQ